MRDRQLERGSCVRRRLRLHQPSRGGDAHRRRHSFAGVPKPHVSHTCLAPAMTQAPSLDESIARGGGEFITDFVHERRLDRRRAAAAAAAAEVAAAAAAAAAAADRSTTGHGTQRRRPTEGP